MGLFAVGASAMMADSVFVEPKHITISKQIVPIHGLPKAFDGFQICQLTDFHHSFFVNTIYIQKVIDRAKSLLPDAMVLTGDYIDGSSAYVNPIAEMLGQIDVPYGVFAVLGNHDHREGNAKLLRKVLHDQDIPVVENTHKFIQKDGVALCIAGVGDLLEGTQDLKSALRGVPPDMPRILLSHHPDYAEEMPRDERVDLVLAGHTHGGQVRMPFSFAPYLSSNYGQKFFGGLVRLEHTQVYVSRGIGVASPPIRFNCPPEITIIELTKAFV